jgi:protein involved in polysaccharide export with SLBB domain
MRSYFVGAFITFVAACIVCGQAVSQTTGSISIPDLLSIKPDNKQEILRPTEKAVPMDAPLNPKDYYVGPNDVIAINIWSSSPVQHQINVTPEGSLLIPSVGEVVINGLSLEGVKQKISNLAKKKYPGAEVSVTLLVPRSVAVKIFGQVLNEGPTVSSSVNRVHQLIADANSLKTGQTMKDYFERVVPMLRSQASQRHIQLRHQDGSVQRVDLVKYEITGDGKYNPYLREGDIVLVPSRDDLRNSLGVFGAAAKRGSFEFVPDDSLGDLIDMGFGFGPRADSTHTLLTRLSFDGTRMDTFAVNAAAIRARKAPNIALQPGDRLVISEIPEERKNYFVSLEGALKQPGFYPITKGTTRLSDVIRLAGGFSPDAFIPGAALIRSRVSPVEADREVERELLLSQRANLTTEDTAYYHIETALRVQGEIVSVDFDRLFMKGDSTQDVILYPFDRIIVPTRRYSIYVFGQVISPGHIQFVNGKSYGYYIERAGGYTSDARSGDIKIIKGKTRAWLSPSETVIEDGDYIWVPREVHRPFSYYITTYAQIASIIGVVATVALLINTVK